MISVAIATYNGEKYIDEQLKSIINQSISIDEIIIVDDCSNDNTISKIEDFQEKYKNNNIRLYKNDFNLGYKKNFHKAISLCKGDYVFLSDQDDIWVSNKVEIMMKEMKENKQIRVLASSFHLIDYKGDSINNTEGNNNNGLLKKSISQKLTRIDIEDIVFHNFCQGCAMVIKRDIIEKFINYFDETLPHDWIINIISSLDGSLYYYDEPLFYYRIHHTNAIGLANTLSFKEKNTSEKRCLVAKNACSVINFIKKFDYNFYDSSKFLIESEKFCNEHIDNLINFKFFRILMQNKNPIYKKLKSFKGRILDLVFVLQNKFLKD